MQQFRILEPYVLGCCYSLDDDIVMETFTVLKCLVEHLTWQHSSSFLTQLTFMLGPLFEEVKPFGGPFPVSGRPRELGRIILKGPSGLSARPFCNGLIVYVLLGNGCKRGERQREQTAVTGEDQDAAQSKQIPGETGGCIGACGGRGELGGHLSLLGEQRWWVNRGG